jgi:hypothetical protein
MTARDDWARLVEETLDADEAEELATARRGSGAKKKLTERQIRARQKAGLAFAMSLSPEDKREIGARLTEARRAAAERRRAEREEAGDPIRDRPSRRREPSESALAPFKIEVLKRWPDSELNALELRREAILLYRVSRSSAVEE